MCFDSHCQKINSHLTANIQFTGSVTQNSVSLKYWPSVYRKSCQFSQEMFQYHFMDL